MALKIHEFNIDKVIIKEPTIDTHGNNALAIKYERNGTEGPLLFECPVVRTDSMGVYSLSGQDGSTHHSIKILFPRKKPVFVEEMDDDGDVQGVWQEPDTIKVPADPNDNDSEMVEVENTYDEAQELAEIIEQIYEKALDHCFKLRKTLKLDIRDRNLMKMIIKNPIYRRSISDEDPTEDPSYPPSLFLKFIESGVNGKNPNRVYTSFQGIDLKPISHNDLERVMMYIVPTIRIEKIFLGGKKNIQCKITKGLVLQMKSQQDLNNDSEKAKELLKQNPAMLDAFLRSYKKTKKDNSTPETKDDSEDEEEEEKAPPSPIVKSGPLPETKDDSEEEEEPEEEPKEKGGLDAFMQQRKPRRIITTKK